VAALDRHGPSGIGRAAVLGIVALALVARALAVFRGAGLLGDIGYDDGVYFSAAVAFVHGVLPYRDVLLLHPPGIVLLLSPFAAIGTLTTEGTGLAIARVAFILLGVANTLLVARLASRQGRTAGILAGVLYAAWHAAAGYERTTLLVPAQSALLLVALLCLDAGRSNDGRMVSRARQVLAGAALGFAASIQLWAVVPLGVIGSWLVLRASRQAGRLRVPISFALAALGTFAVVMLTFLVIAGDTMIREVLLDQLGRPNNGISLIARLRTLEGLGQVRPYLPGLIPLAAAVAAAAAVGWVAYKSPATRVFAILFVIQTAVILLTPVSFPHYSAWPAPMGAVTFGVAGSLLLDWIARPRIARLALLGYVALIAILLIPDVGRAGFSLPLAALANDTMGARCVATDEPVLLIELDRIGRSIARGCPVIVDPTGVAYDTDRGLLTPGSVEATRSRAVNFQRVMLAYFGTADVAMFARPSLLGLTPQSWATLQCRLSTQRRRVTILVLLRDVRAISTTCPN
jgi:alpha-1,2-mannosyltransferase